MLKLARKVEYALIALVELAARGPGGLATAKEIARRCRVPADLVGKVLQRLARLGVIESVQGACGGYRLTRPAREITLGGVIEALEGPVGLTPCTRTKGVAACSRSRDCVIRAPISRVRQELVSFLDGITLERFQGSGDS